MAEGIQRNEGLIQAALPEMLLANGVRVSELGVAHGGTKEYNQARSELLAAMSSASFVAVEGLNPDDNKFFELLAPDLPEGVPLIAMDPRDQVNNILFNRIATITDSPLMILSVGSVAEILAIIQGVRWVGEGVRQVKNDSTRRGLLGGFGKIFGGGAIASSAATGLAVNTATDALIDSIKTQLSGVNDGLEGLSARSALGLEQFRTTAMMVSLQKAAEQGLIKGRGVMIVGADHPLEMQKLYGNNPAEAESVFHNNVYYKILQLLGGQTIGIYMKQSGKIAKIHSMQLVPSI